MIDKISGLSGHPHLPRKGLEALGLFAARSRSTFKLGLTFQVLIDGLHPTQRGPWAVDDMRHLFSRSGNSTAVGRQEAFRLGPATEADLGKLGPSRFRELFADSYRFFCCDV